jgi:hypothetical protein
MSVPNRSEQGPSPIEAKDLQINCRSFYDGNFMPEEGGQLVKGDKLLKTSNNDLQGHNHNFYNTFSKAS